MPIPLSARVVSVLFVAFRTKVVHALPRTIAEPPLLDMVLPDAVISRFVKVPAGSMYKEFDVFAENVLSVNVIDP